MHVTDLSIPPPVQHPLGPVDHHLAVGLDPVVMEGGRHQPALPKPEVALARQEPLSEDGLDVTPEEGVLGPPRRARGG